MNTYSTKCIFTFIAGVFVSKVAFIISCVTVLWKIKRSNVDRKFSKNELFIIFYAALVDAHRVRKDNYRIRIHKASSGA